MKQADNSLFQTLQAQYQHLGWPVDLMEADLEFTIFNLKDLHQPLAFESTVSRLNFFVFGFVKNARGRYVVDEQQFTMGPGTIYFTNPGHYRFFSYQTIEEVCLITLSESFLKENVHADIFGEFPFLLAETFPALTVPPAVSAEFERLYLQLHHEYRVRSSFRKQRLEHLFIKAVAGSVPMPTGSWQ